MRETDMSRISVISFLHLSAAPPPSPLSTSAD